MPAIEPRVISRRGEEGAERYSDSACGQHEWIRAEPRTKVPQLQRRCAQRRAAQSGSKATDSSTDDGDPCPQRPCHRAPQRINQADETHFVARFRKPPCNLEGHESTEGIAAQVVGTGWLARLDLSQILLRHHLYARARSFPTCETARLNANDRARVGHASCRRQDFNDIPANAVDEEERRRTLASLQGNELDIARRAVLSQDLAKLTKSRRLVEQRR